MQEENAVARLAVKRKSWLYKSLVGLVFGGALILGPLLDRRVNHYVAEKINAPLLRYVIPQFEFGRDPIYSVGYLSYSHCGQTKVIGIGKDYKGHLGVDKMIIYNDW